jgi:hypothetical protein
MTLMDIAAAVSLGCVVLNTLIGLPIQIMTLIRACQSRKLSKQIHKHLTGKDG